MPAPRPGLRARCGSRRVRRALPRGNITRNACSCALLSGCFSSCAFTSAAQASRSLQQRLLAQPRPSPLLLGLAPRCRRLRTTLLLLGGVCVVCVASCTSGGGAPRFVGECGAIAAADRTVATAVRCSAKSASSSCWLSLRRADAC